MSDNDEPEKLIFKATVKDNQIRINIANGNELLLCTALHKLRLMIDGLLAMRELAEAKKAKSPIIVGQSGQQQAQSIMDKIRSNKMG